jgi:glutathione peroxidase
MNATFYQLSAKNIKGEEVKMNSFKGNMILVVNTASKCGFTPQFEGLETLYRKYKDKGLVVLGFPCNQFANQEPGDEQSIAAGCVIDYNVTFPMFSKVEVNGENAHPIYKFLKSELSSIFGPAIKWNFTKFLLDKNGKPLKRFSPFNKPEEIDRYLAGIL